MSWNPCQRRPNYFGENFPLCRSWLTWSTIYHLRWDSCMVAFFENESTSHLTGILMGTWDGSFWKFDFRFFSSLGHLSLMAPSLFIPHLLIHTQCSWFCGVLLLGVLKSYLGAPCGLEDNELVCMLHLGNNTQSRVFSHLCFFFNIVKSLFGSPYGQVYQTT